jgi:hypothetical protein
MADASDHDILRHIETLIAEEHRLYHQPELTVTDRDKLESLAAEVDGLWDELRRIRAERRTGVVSQRPHQSGSPNATSAGHRR